MANTVKIKHSDVSTAVPATLEQGELAINTADALLFWEDSVGAINSTHLSPAPSDIGAATAAQGSLADSAVQPGDLATVATSGSYSDLANIPSEFTPTAHASTHATGGSDALTPADIGAAPAASPTFTGVITVSAGTAAAPALVASGDSNTGAFFPAADTFAISTAGYERVRVDGSGRVGIGATPSSRRLTVRGGSTSDGALLLQSSSTGTDTVNGFIIQCFGAASDAYVWNFENAPIIFGANNAERMRLTAAGDLGLGPSRTAPASRLDVNGVITVSAGTAAAPAIISGTGTSDTGVFWPAADTWAVSTAGTERLRVDAAGRVGIGHATPADFNQVVSAPHAVIGNGSSASGVTIYSGTGVSGSLAFADGTTTTDQYRGLLAYTHSVDAMRFFTSATERVRIDSSGNVGIGTSSPSALLDINADTIRLRTAKTPASASDTGNAGDICWDSSYIYVCVATNTWRRIAHSTW